jgi:hypothetical protein
MSHPGRSHTHRLTLLTASALFALIAFGTVTASHAGDGDGVGGFKYKIKMEGEEDTPVFGGSDLLLGSSVEGPGDDHLSVGEGTITRSELLSWSDLVRFLSFLTVRR